MDNYKISEEIVNGVTYRPRLAAVSPEEVQPNQLPVGRISVDESTTFSQMMSDLAFETSTRRAAFPFDLLEVMQNLSLVNPDVSQMIDNIVQLGNTGHTVVVDSKQDEEILEALNSMTMNVFHSHGGVDGFVNSALAQIGRAGAVSCEWVVEKNLSGL